MAVSKLEKLEVSEEWKHEIKPVLISPLAGPVWLFCCVCGHNCSVFGHIFNRDQCSKSLFKKLFFAWVENSWGRPWTVEALSCPSANYYFHSGFLYYCEFVSSNVMSSKRMQILPGAQFFFIMGLSQSPGKSVSCLFVFKPSLKQGLKILSSE